MESLGERSCEGLEFGFEELQKQEAKVKAKAKKVLESISLGVWSSLAT